MRLCEKRQNRARVDIDEILERVNVGAVYKVLSILQLQNKKKFKRKKNSYHEKIGFIPFNVSYSFVKKTKGLGLGLLSKSPRINHSCKFNHINIHLIAIMLS